MTQKSAIHANGRRNRAVRLLHRAGPVVANSQNMFSPRSQIHAARVAPEKAVSRPALPRVHFAGRNRVTQ